MKFERTSLDGVLIITPDVFKDARGYFFESFSKRKYEEIGIKGEFVQDNISKSTYGTIRGLHYQVPPYEQGKLCQVVKGTVLDVAVDIRFGSPTFGKYISVILSDSELKQVWIPPGFAHGFSVLSDEAIFSYKCTGYYNRESERCILYSDPALSINWQITNPVVSEKDLKGKLLQAIEKDFVI
jgi:dTDP-4-dehydrorhamnose 3,5-epimerase